jgi:hypothetical protein
LRSSEAFLPLLGDAGVEIGPSANQHQLHDFQLNDFGFRAILFAFVRVHHHPKNQPVRVHLFLDACHLQDDALPAFFDDLLFEIRNQHEPPFHVKKRRPNIPLSEAS